MPLYLSSNMDYFVLLPLFYSTSIPLGGDGLFDKECHVLNYVVKVKEESDSKYVSLILPLYTMLLLARS
jgi:hypothetical protein